jgi:hypothetical protein
MTVIGGLRRKEKTGTGDVIHNHITHHQIDVPSTSQRQIPLRACPPFPGGEIHQDKIRQAATHRNIKYEVVIKLWEKVVRDLLSAPELQVIRA